MKVFLYHLASFFLSLFLFCTSVFLIYHFVPSAPIEAIMQRNAQYSSKSSLSKQAKEALREQLHLNDPLHKQYSNFLSGIFKFELGESLWTGQQVGTLIKKRAIPTLSMGFWTLVFSLPLGLGLGLVQAYFWKRWQGLLIGFFLNLLFCVPSFSLATFFIFSDFAFLKHFGPLAVYLAAPVPYLALLIRRKLLQEEREPYATAVLAKGLSKWQLHYRHLLRPCWLTVISFLPLGWSLFWGTSLVVEPIFRIQGLGILALEGYRNQDLPLLTGVTLIMGCGRILLNSFRELLFTRFLPSLESRGKP